MLQVEIAKEFSDFSLQVKFAVDNRILVLFGPSGCGKTTVLRCIAGLTRPDSGRISLDNRVFYDTETRVNLPSRLRGVGYVFQDYALFPHMTVKKNILYGAKGLEEQNWCSFDDLVDTLKIGHLSSRYPMDLSGGEQQRVALARALMAEPAMLLLDEPLSALHEEIRLELQEELVKMQRVWKIPFILVTHDSREAEKVGDRIIRLDHGRIVN